MLLYDDRKCWVLKDAGHFKEECAKSIRKRAEHLQHLLASVGVGTLSFSQLRLSTHQGHLDNELGQIHAPWLA